MDFTDRMQRTMLFFVLFFRSSLLGLPSFLHVGGSNHAPLLHAYPRNPPPPFFLCHLVPHDMYVNKKTLGM